MKSIAIGCLILSCSLLVAQATAAQTLFYDDFQDGDALGWFAGGKGDVVVNNYKGNFSLRLTKSAYAIVPVAVAGSQRIRIGGAIAAGGLGKKDACLVQYSLDEAGPWITVLRVGDGQDDSVTLHSAATSLDLPAGLQSIRVLARAINSGPGSTCWIDNVYVAGDAATGQRAADERRTLSRDFLLSNESLQDPVDMREFMPPADAAKPLHRFSGALRLLRPDQTGDSNIISDALRRVSKIGEPLRHLPEFDFEFVQRGSDIVPLKSGLQRRQHPYWEIILQPGKVWSEAGDGDWSRAAIPFSLQERSANCTHNGVMTWLYNDHEVSRVAYQIVSETCGYLKLDLWGAASAAYSPGDLGAAATAVIGRMDSHRASRMPVRPLAQLATDYPGVEPLGLGVDDGIPPDDMTVLGLVVDGINYRSECQTRFGPHPFCASLPLPSFSTAKSIFAGIATMRMQQLFPGSAQTTIASLIDACSAKKWRGVTIQNALDMATGNYRSKASSADEDARPHERFVYDDTHQSKLDFACNYFKRKQQPGSQFVYHTSDSYLVGVALSRLLARHMSDAELYEDLLVKPIWHVLNLSPLLDTTKRSYDATAQPFVGYGLTYEVDDIVRIASWLSNDDARFGDQQMLDSTMLQRALQRIPGDRGLPAGNENLRYSNGFWAFNAGPSLGCESSVWVPFMSGVSGITVAMLPNGIIYYYFSDGYTFRWQSGRQAAHKIRAMCR